MKRQRSRAWTAGMTWFEEQDSALNSLLNIELYVLTHSLSHKLIALIYFTRLQQDMRGYCKAAVRHARCLYDYTKSSHACISPANAARLPRNNCAMNLRFIIMLHGCWTSRTVRQLMKFARLSQGRTCNIASTSEDSPVHERKTIVRASYGCLTFSENQFEVFNFVCDLPHGLMPVVNRTAKRSYNWCETGITKVINQQMLLADKELTLWVPEPNYSQKIHVWIQRGGQGVRTPPEK